MKVLQVCPGAYVSGRGGVSEHVMRISEGLAKRGHDVTVFATNPGGLAWFEVVNGVKVRRFRRFAPGGAYFLSPVMLLALARAVDFDVVHAHGFHAFPMHFASFAKCRRFVVTTHFHGAGHSVFRNRLFKLFEPFGRLTLLTADVVVAVSEYERRLLLKRFRLNEQKVVVIPNGLDFSEFDGLRRKEKRFRSVLYVGRLEEYKGVHYLIAALPLLPEDVILEIVGRGTLKVFLEKRIRELGLVNRVRFYQDLARLELLQLFVDADVFVLLSRFESYSLVVAEALAVGTPCIVAKTSALSEWINEVKCFGLNLPVSVKDLAQKIREVIAKDGSLHKKLEGENARNRQVQIASYADKIPSWHQVTIELEKLYAG